MSVISSVSHRTRSTHHTFHTAHSTRSAARTDISATSAGSLMIKRREEERAKMRRSKTLPPGYSNFLKNLPSIGPLKLPTKLCIRVDDINDLEMALAKISSTTKAKKRRLPKVKFSICDYSQVERPEVLSAELDPMVGMIVYHPANKDLKYMIVSSVLNSPTQQGVIGILKHPMDIPIYRLIRHDDAERNISIEKAITGIAEQGVAKSLTLQKNAGFSWRSFFDRLRLDKVDYRILQHSKAIVRFKHLKTSKNEFYTIQFPTRNPLDMKIKTIALGIGIVLTLTKSQQPMNNLLDF